MATQSALFQTVQIVVRDHNQSGSVCRYHNQSGVGIRPYDWGGLGGVKALDPGLPQASGIFSRLVDALEQAGYREREDLYGAPFDFRLAPDGLSQVIPTDHLVLM